MAGNINNVLGILTPVLLLCSGLYFLFRLKGFCFFHPIKMIKTILKKEKGDGNSPVRALTLALAGTLGVGNIVGVASSIKLGGYGAVFWMWVSAAVAMILKYAEIVLALIYRRVGKDGEFHGGAYYYIREFFVKNKLARLGSFMGGLFAILCIMNSVSMGGIIQANAISSAFLGEFGVPLWLSGLVVALFSLFIIMGNSEKIASFTEKIVCVMSIGYTVVSVAVMGVYHDRILPSLFLIFESAFNFKSAGFGVLGFLFASSFRLGCMRGLMSNEAGCGTAPTAHASSNVSMPAKQGLLGVVEVFVDTIVLCSMTAFVIIIAGERVLINENPMMITLSSFEILLGEAAGIFICISVLLFGFATIVCWAHYGREALNFICKSTLAGKIFVLLYAVFVFFGSVCSVSLAWDIADLCLGLMTVINVIILCLMNKDVKSETDKLIMYWKIMKNNSA